MPAIRLFLSAPRGIWQSVARGLWLCDGTKPLPAHELRLVFNYHFGGIGITSEIPLTGLREAPADAAFAGAIHVAGGRGPTPVEERSHFVWPGRFGLRLGEAGGYWLVSVPWGAFLFDAAAERVRIFGLDGAGQTVLNDILVRRLLPRLVKLKGAATYHAASLARDGKGVLLMGQSGAGKSTMSIGLAGTGRWELLGDDMALLWHNAGKRIPPAGAEAGVWASSCEGLGLADSDYRPLSGYDGKHLYRQRGVRHATSAPAAGLFFLERAECAGPTAVRCTPAEAFRQALTQIIYFNPSGAAAEERLTSVQHLNAMLARIPAWTLTYPPSFAAVRDVSGVIEAALESL